jgi:DNA-directed RNA polymerase subunit M
MVPRKKNGKIVLVCTRCGYEIEASEKDLKSYMATSKAEKEAHVKTTGEVSETTTTSSAAKTKEELEQARENYYELVLDQLGEYGE